MPTPNDPYDDIVTPPVPDDRLSELADRSAARPSELELNPPRHNGSKRRHAAKGSRSAALGLAVVSTLGMAAYLHQASQSSGSAATIASAPATTSTKKPFETKSLADGVWNGDSSTNRWGLVQVAITVSGGKITAASAPLYPSDDNRSLSINRIAIPKLVQSTLTAQNANVNSVSGATSTSESYQTSLQSAIDQSHASS